MKIYTLFILFLLLAFYATISAQDAREDVIYMKSGNVYRGVLVEQVPGVSYKIEIAGGSVINMKADEVEKVAKENKTRPSYDSGSDVRYYTRQPHPFVYRDKGYFFQTLIEAGFFEGGFRIINGYKFSQYTSLGLGVGMEAIHNGAFVNKNEDFFGYYFPLFAYLAGDILHKKVTPFYQLSAGYTFWSVANYEWPFNLGYSTPDLIDNRQGGFMAGAGFGVKFYTTNRVNVTLSGNVDVKNPSALLTTYNYTYNHDVTARSSVWLVLPSIMLGIGF